jgi:hypothetical protein
VHAVCKTVMFRDETSGCIQARLPTDNTRVLDKRDILFSIAKGSLEIRFLFRYVLPCWFLK